MAESDKFGGAVRGYITLAAIWRRGNYGKTGPSVQICQKEEETFIYIIRTALT